MDTWNPLSYRILGSARGLACSTFSGVAGIEAELRDPRAGKQAGLTRVQRPLDVGPDGRNSRQRKQKHLFTKGFREEPATSSASVNAEEDFDEWQRGGEEPIGEGRWCGTECFPASGLEDTAHPLPPPPPQPSQLDYEVFQEGMCAFQEGWRTPQSLKSDARVGGTSDLDTEPLNLAWESIGGERLREKDRCLNSTAVRRLDQLESHLLRPRDAEALRQASWQQTAGRMDEMLYQQSQHQQARVADPRREARQHAEFAHESPHQPLHQQPQPQPPSQPNHQPQRTDEEEELEERIFRCPYFDCHRNLHHLQSSTLNNRAQKPCIHVGCAFVADSPSKWVEHVVAPHHDILGSVAVTEEDMEAAWAKKQVNDSAADESDVGIGEDAMDVDEEDGAD